MHAAANTLFIFLELVLAPIFYPHVYLIQLAALACSYWWFVAKRALLTKLITPLLLVILITNTILSENIPLMGMVARLTFILMLCVVSPQLQTISVQLIDPYNMVFILTELLFAPHFFPFGYMAQLFIFLFIYLFYGGNLLSPAMNTSTVSAALLSAKKLEEITNEDEKLNPNENSDEAMLCKICLDMKATSAFIPCGHVCCKRCCEDLAKRQNRLVMRMDNENCPKRCPFCNAEVTQKLLLYFP